MAARIPIVLDALRKESYEWAATVTESESLSWWIRDVLDAEVRRLQKQNHS